MGDKDKNLQNQSEEQQSQAEEQQNQQEEVQLQDAEAMTKGLPEGILDFIEFPPRDRFKRLLIPGKYVYGGTVEELEEYLKTPGLSNDVIQYISGRIQNEKFYSELEKNKHKSEPQPGTVKDGEIKLDHIHQYELQGTGNGCYSASLVLLLQSRGVYLNQKMIRAYRPLNNSEDRNRMFDDNEGNTKQLYGLVTKLMPNTGMITVEYNNGGSSREGDELNATCDDIIATIKDALYNKKSPISLLYRHHYRTIIGYDEKNKEIIYKTICSGPISLYSADFNVYCY